MAEFRDRLEEGLCARHMTPAELSKITGIGEGAISQYRKGAYKATQRNLEKIALALNISIPWLMGITDDPSPPPASISLAEQEEEAAPIQPDEQKLLDGYRQLNQQGKEYILQTVDMATRVYVKNIDLSSVEDA